MNLKQKNREKIEAEKALVHDANHVMEKSWKSIGQNVYEPCNGNKITFMV